MYNHDLTVPANYALNPLQLLPGYVSGYRSIFPGFPGPIKRAIIAVSVLAALSGWYHYAERFF